MKIFFDERDDSGRGAERISWLEDVGARPLIEAEDHEHGFIFSLTPDLDAYRRAIAGRPDLDDQAGERAPIDRFDLIIEGLRARGVPAPSTRLWSPREAVDPGLFPLELRPRAGLMEREATLVESAESLERGLEELGGEGLLAAPAPGRRPGRLRLWVVDARPCAWSQEREAEPVAEADLRALASAAAAYAAPFGSRFIVFDFAPLESGWILDDAGPGSRALTRNESALKAAAEALLGRPRSFASGPQGGSVPRAWLC